MALFKIFKGPAQNLGAAGNPTELTRTGFAYFTPDDGRFYIDISDGDTPIIGSSTADGANRICINSGGFMNNLILDCGTASGWTQTTIVYFDLGDSDLTDELEVILYDSGDSDLSDELEVTLYDSGDSFYNI